MWELIERRGAASAPVALLTESPCQACGACCAALRVQFPHEDGPSVPAELTEPTLPGHARMKRRADGGCAALVGTPGQGTACAIYADRPWSCKVFAPSIAGRVNPFCDASRARFGLPPLR